GHVAPGMRQTGDETKVDRIARGGEDNRDRCGGCLRGERRRRTGCRNDRHLALYQIGNEFRQPIIVAIRPPVFDHDVLTFDKTHLVQAAAEFVDEVRVKFWCSAGEEAAPGHLVCGLRMGSKRPSPRAEKWEEFAALHAPPP